MKKLELEACLINILKDRTKEEDMQNISFFIYELQSKFNFDTNDICYILYKCPILLKKNSYALANNLSNLAKNFNLKDIELKYLILKQPNLLVFKEAVFKYKLNLISTVYGCSIKDSVKLLYLYPDLLFIEKNNIKNKVENICKTLNEYGLKVRAMLRREPGVILSDIENINSIKKYLMKNYTLSEEESQKVITHSPEIILNGVEYVISKFNFYYPKYFIKRDLKEILSSNPEFLKISEKEFLLGLESVKNVFSVEEKKACDFIRLEPKVLYFKPIKDKIKSFMKYNINLNYIFMSPKMCLIPEISVPLKFILARVLSLESEFNKIAVMDSNLFISRFLFMQANKLYNHLDLLESEEFFWDKYNISSSVLKVNYKLNYESMKNLCAYYINSKDKMKYWSDMLFPEWEDILEYLYGNFDKNFTQTQNYLMLKESNNLTKRQYNLYKELKAMHLSEDEILYVINKNQVINKYLVIEFKNIAYALKKIGFTHEQILKLLMQKTYLFCYSMREFNYLLEEVCEIEKCSEDVAVNEFM